MYTLTLKKLLLFIFLLIPSLAVAAGLGELRLSLIEGDVQIKTADTEDWTPAVINFPLKAGDQLWVPNGGRAEIKSRRGNIVRLDEKTALDVLMVEQDTLQFYLSMGLAYVNATGERNTTLQLDTPLSSIQVQERAKFSTEVANERLSVISVYLGKIIAENRKGATDVQAGKLLTIDRSTTDLSTLGMIDSWERWNGEQDQVAEEQATSLNYLPEEMAGYANDFDNNGRWVNMPTYGYVWRPTVQVNTDWSPYRHGRWVWINNDYVWIAREPWGWAPYHYGRWSFISQHGWCWVPPARHEAHWGPGYVAWVRTPTYVSWVPLAPREVYYGHGNYGPHSVNINHVDIQHVVIKNVYKNVSVKNSVTTVHNDTFLRGKHVDFKVKENPFLKEKINIGRPQIHPERETKSAGIRKIPPINQPPETVRNVDIEKLQERHHLKKNRKKSADLSEKEMHQSRPVEQEALTPQTSTSPPIGKHQDRQIPPSNVNDRQSPREEAVNRPDRQEVHPSPRQEEIPPVVEQEASAPPLAAPAPTIRQEDRQRPPSKVNDRQSPREEVKTRPDRQEIQPPASQEDPPPAVEQEVPAPQISVPPPANRHEKRQIPPSGASDRQSPHEEVETRPNRQEIQPPARQEPPPPAVEQEVPAPQISVPPPPSRHEGRQRPQFEESSRHAPQEKRVRQDRQEIQPPARQEPPPPAIEQVVPAPQLSAPAPANRQVAPPQNKEARQSKKNRHKGAEGEEDSEGSDQPSEPEIPLPEQPSKQ